MTKSVDNTKVWRLLFNGIGLAILVLVTINDILTVSFVTSLIAALGCLILWLATWFIYKYRENTFASIKAFYPESLSEKTVFNRISFFLIALLFISIIPLVYNYFNKTSPAIPSSAQELAADSTIVFTHPFLFGDTTFQSITKDAIQTIYRRAQIKGPKQQNVLLVKLMSGDTLSVNSCAEFSALKNYESIPLGPQSALQENVFQMNCQILDLALKFKRPEKSYFEKTQLFATPQWPIHFLNSINPKIRAKIDRDGIQGKTFQDWIEAGELKISNIKSTGATYAFGEEKIMYTTIMFGEFNGDGLEDLIMAQTTAVNKNSSSDLELILVTKLGENGKIEKIQ